ncbi:MAG: menB [Symbiobacteriaceae bacterium]|nr:menB [Symbiobacteriaceae bacterium]
MSDVLFGCDGGSARITINRPEVHNAFRNQTLDELTEAFEAANRDDGVGVIVLGAAGGRAFCSGGDVNEEDAFDPVRGRQHHRRLIRLSEAIRNGGKPVVCAVDGYCLGGGNSLMLLCDLTIATEGSVFGQVGPKMGSAPLWWSTQLLPRLVGEKRAREIVFLCRRYSAPEALQMGWINRVVPAAALEAAVQEWCETLLSMSPQALRIAKMSLNYESDQLWASVVHGLGLLAYAHGTEEFHEGTRAFLEKRRPDWGQFRGR